MKKAPTVKDAALWIALNDGPGDELELRHLRGFISVILVADLFGVSNEYVARLVARFRKENA